MRSLTRLLPFFRPYRGRLALGLLLVVATAALGSIIPWLLRAAIDAIQAGAPARRLWRIGGLMVGSAVVAGLFRYWMRELMNGLSRWIEYDLRNVLFARLERLDQAYFATNRTGDLMARLTNDLSAVRMTAGPAIMYFANTVFGGLFALGFMLRIDVRLTALALLPTVLLPVIMVKLGRLIHDRFEEVQEHFGTMTTRAQENLAGARIVRAYRQEAAEVARFGALNEEYLRRNLELARLHGLMDPSLGLLGGLGALVVLGFGGTLALRGTISVGAFIAFGFYLAMLTWPLIALGWVINLFQRGAASMSRLLGILDASPAIVDPPRPRSLPATAEGREIEFRGVGFHYPTPEGEALRWVLRDVSFRIPGGGTLGVVGATGSGKSALMDLIPRLADPQEGEVLIDGVPIRELPLEALRREIGYVPQETLLFSETIEANLRYGGASREDALAAARIARLDETITSFPGGYETLLGERGINLSGGQKQRASLARALARRPSIVLLDDALSAVDTHTESEILHGLGHALSRLTAVIASHRISAIRDASWIIVLDEGRVVEQGRHDELLARRGRYWSLLRRQRLEESIEAGDDGTPADDGTGADRDGDEMSSADAVVASDVSQR